MTRQRRPLCLLSISSRRLHLKLSSTPLCILFLLDLSTLLVKVLPRYFPFANNSLTKSINAKTTPTTIKMSVVSLLGVEVKNNPAKFGDKYEFEITFECLESLQQGMLHGRSGLWHMADEGDVRCSGTDSQFCRSRVEVDLCRLCYLVSFLHFPFMNVHS